MSHGYEKLLVLCVISKQLQNIWKIEKNRENTRKTRGHALKKIFSLVSIAP